MTWYIAPLFSHACKVHHRPVIKLQKNSWLVADCNQVRNEVRVCESLCQEAGLSIVRSRLQRLAISRPLDMQSRTRSVRDRLRCRARSPEDQREHIPRLRLGTAFVVFAAPITFCKKRCRLQNDKYEKASFHAHVAQYDRAQNRTYHFRILKTQPPTWNQSRTFFILTG